MPSSAAESIVFDMNILGMGKWKKNEKTLIEGWIKEDGFDEKRVAASNLISIMIPRMLKEDCSTVGKVKSKRLGGMLQHFEDLLATAKAGMARKFYRDHLNHMLRVMLLANAISARVRSFSLSERELESVTLAGLVHDIAYPLAESYLILHETAKSMSSCYDAFSFPDFKLTYKKSKVRRIAKLIGSEIIPPMQLNRLLREYDHGLIGAIEFSDYIHQKKVKNFKELLHAIVFHSPSTTLPAELRKSPTIAVLILSDELQDWGRPVGIERQPAVPSIGDFHMTPKGISGVWKWGNWISISPLRQVFSKMKNLERVIWPTSLNVDLSFMLPNYSNFSIGKFEGVLGKIVDYCQKNRPDCIKSLCSSWQKNKEMFHSYYGRLTPRSDNLFEFLEVSQTDSKIMNSIYFDSRREEALATETNLGKLSNIKLEISSSLIGLILSGQKGSRRGRLLAESDEIVEKPLRSFLAKMIVFHGIVARIPREEDEGLLSTYPYPSLDLTEKALAIVGFKEKASTLVEDLRGLRRCMLEDGFFAFAST